VREGSCVRAREGTSEPAPWLARASRAHPWGTRRKRRTCSYHPRARGEEPPAWRRHTRRVRCCLILPLHTACGAVTPQGHAGRRPCNSHAAQPSAPHVHFSALPACPLACEEFCWCVTAERPRTRRAGRCVQQLRGAWGDAPRSTPIVKDTVSGTIPRLIYYTYTPYYNNYMTQTAGIHRAEARQEEWEAENGESEREIAAHGGVRPRAPPHAVCSAPCPPKGTAMWAWSANTGATTTGFTAGASRFCIHVPCMCHRAGCRCWRGVRVPAPPRPPSYCA